MLTYQGRTTESGRMPTGLILPQNAEFVLVFSEPIDAAGSDKENRDLLSRRQAVNSLKGVLKGKLPENFDLEDMKAERRAARGLLEV